MRRSARSRRSAAAFYVTAIGAIVGAVSMTRTCSAWVRDGAPEIALALVGLGALLLATLAVLRDGRVARPVAASRPQGETRSEP